MTYHRSVIDWIGQHTGLGDILAPIKSTEYVRARAVAIKLITESGLGTCEAARLFKREPKTIRHAINTWPHLWAKDGAAMRIYRAAQAHLAE